MKSSNGAPDFPSFDFVLPSLSSMDRKPRYCTVLHRIIDFFDDGFLTCDECNIGCRHSLAYKESIGTDPAHLAYCERLGL